MTRLAAITVCVLCSCKQTDDTDPTEQMFARDRVLRISITIDDAHWDELRHQSRHGLDVLGESCNVTPPARPYTYFPADVSIDGGTTTHVGIRKKGFFGSLSSDRPSLKLKFSEYVKGQLFSGMKRMTLNNNLGDPSQIRQCIGYDLFARAGVPAPRCNFATVEVNGVNLGVYTHVESIKKRFLARHFDDNDGNLYEGALTTDFRPGWVNTFEQKTNRNTPDRSDIETLVPALQVDDSDLLETLEPLVNLPSFLAFWAMEVILMHADGYSRAMNNYYVYRDPNTEKFTFIPWGADVILYPDQPREWEPSVPPGVAWAEGVLSRRLYLHPDTQASYLSQIQQLLDTVWDEPTIQAEIDRLETMLAPEFASAPVGERKLVARSVDEVREFVASRRSDLESLLTLPAATWTRPLRDPFCLAPIGEASGAFATRWQTLNVPDPFGEGSGSVELRLNNDAVSEQSVGAIAGTDEATGESYVRIQFAANSSRRFAVEIPIAPTVFAGPFPVEIDIRPGGGSVHELIESDNGTFTRELRAEFGGGHLRLEQAGLNALAAISGSFSASLYLLP